MPYKTLSTWQPWYVSVLVVLFGLLATTSKGQRFSGTSVFAVPGIYPTSVSVTDYDRDGDDDLLVVDLTSNDRVRLFESKDGSLIEIAETGLPASASGAIWTDYNNDLFPDVFIYSTNRLKSTAAFYIQKDGAFTPVEVAVPNLLNPQFSLTDHDQDGDIDIVALGYNTGYIYQSYLLENNANVYKIVQLPVANYSYTSTIAWSDFDNDSDLDLFVSGYSKSALFKNMGNNSFELFSDQFPGGLLDEPKWQDFDNDNDVDLLLITYSGKGGIYLNNEGKNFMLYDGLTLPGSLNGQVEWVDYDSDGDFDIFHSGYLAGAYFINLFEYSSAGYNLLDDLGMDSGPKSGFVFLDYDKDKDLDIALLSDLRKARIIRNNLGSNPYDLDTKLISPQFLVAHSIDSTSIQLTWMDYNGIEDYYEIEVAQLGDEFQLYTTAIGGSIQGGGTVIIPNLQPNKRYAMRVRSVSNVFGRSPYSDVVYSEVATRNLHKRPLPTLYATSQSRWADIDSDGDLDLIYSGTLDEAHAFEPKTIVLKNTNGNFVEQVHNFPNMYIRDFDWADFDNDGDLDVIISGRSKGSELSQTRLLVNEGNFDFTEHPVAIIGVSGFSRWIDANSDGYQDIYVSGSRGSYGMGYGSQLLLNNRDKTFTETFNTGLPTYQLADVAILDFNGDGKEDLIIGGLKDTVNSLSMPSIEVYSNENGKFKFHQRLNGKPYSCDIEIADFDQDGDADIAIAGEANNMQIFWNQNGHFKEDSWPKLPEFREGSLATGDVDNDGDIDLVLSGSRFAKVFLNNGSGVFTQGYFPLNPNFSRFSFGDSNRDGDLDLFMSGSGYSGLLENRIAIVNNKPTKPSNVKAEPLAGGMLLSWHRGTDDSSPTQSMTSNIFIEDSSGKRFYDATSRVTDGVRSKPSYGNAYFNESLIVEELPAGRYSIGIQTIDNSFLASNFSVVNCAITNVPPTLQEQPIACENSKVELRVQGYAVQWYRDEGLTVSIANGNVFSPQVGTSDTTFYAVQNNPDGKSPPLKVNVKVLHKVAGAIVSKGDSLEAPLAASYFWSKNGARIEGQESRSIKIDSPGKYSVLAANAPCIAQTFDYIVKPMSPMVEYSKELCVGQDQLLIANAYDVKWFNSKGEQIGSDSSFEIKSVTITDTLIYVSQVVNQIESSKTEVRWRVDLYPGNVVTFNGSQLRAPKGTTYQWFLNNVEIAGATEQSIEAEEDGIYHVVVTNNVCSTKSQDYIFTATTESLPDFSLFQPYPDKKVIAVTYYQYIERVLVHDQLGRPVEHLELIRRSGNYCELDLRSLPSGVYTIIIDAEKPIHGRVAIY